MIEKFCIDLSKVALFVQGGVVIHVGDFRMMVYSKRLPTHPEQWVAVYDPVTETEVLDSYVGRFSRVQTVKLAMQLAEELVKIRCAYNAEENHD